jgi:hypothetical protein
MKHSNFLLIICLAGVIVSCGPCDENPNNKAMDNSGYAGFIPKTEVDSVILLLKKNFPDVPAGRIEKGVTLTAELWNETDGTPADFRAFCLTQFLGTDSLRSELLKRAAGIAELLYGCYNKISLEMKIPVHVDGVTLLPIDDVFAAFDPSAHHADDFYRNKVAFVYTLNFPFFSLDEKNKAGKNWSRTEWAMARLGDFPQRIPSDKNSLFSETYAKADAYIAGYNIFMGNVIKGNAAPAFPADMKLITHWGLRDELKANYKAEGGLSKQQTIYSIMKRIIQQDIPAEVINNNTVQWDPFSNTVTKDGKTIETKPEGGTRYQHMLNLFHALKAIDPYRKGYKNYIQYQFESGFEMTEKEIEELFIGLLSSPQVKDVAALISKRLGRNLEPFDIWYDGFKSRSSIPDEELSKMTRSKYPNRDAFQADLPVLLKKLGFAQDKAAFLASQIHVDPSRGAGHAWEAGMKTEKARLRSRIGADGMDYKGYNIAVHEFGHNVEQTITLHYVDNYLMRGVPNTAFTEALAFVFQSRDLELLGYNDKNPQRKSLATLDNFWSSYEIMGVALVDMYVWRWLYDNPDADVAALQENVIRISKEVWNKYYAPVFGKKDEPILAVYSHMIDNPLYLPAYPLGHIIEFQLEKHLEGKNFAEEVERIYKVGKLTPQLWMQNAVGEKVSVKPMLEATAKALESM